MFVFCGDELLDTVMLNWAFKKKKAPIARYDLYVDKVTKIIYICNKRGEIVCKTHYKLR